VDRQPRERSEVAWQQVFDDLAVRDQASLGVDDLERLAEAAFWLGRPRDVVGARRRAYACHRDAAEHERAARVCWQLFHSHFELNETATAAGWLRRAQRHLLEVPGSPERGYVAVAASMWARYSGDGGEAVDQAASARRLGDELHDRDLSAWGLALEGGMRIAEGDVTGGVALLDESMVETASGDLSPFVTGWIYCFLLKTCQALGDIGRAGEWTDAAVQWCRERGVDSWYPGLCRLHRCEVSSLRGEWGAAEREALRAADELAPFGDYLTAEGEYLAGEIRRRRGDEAGAEEAFRRAHRLGRDPQPGLALLRLAQGDTQGAVRQLRRAVSEGPSAPLPRARLLIALVTAELAVGDTAAAAQRVEELAATAGTGGSRLIWAMLAGSHGALLLARGDAPGALPLLREAAEAYQQLGCPYETAQVRVLLGEAARQADDDETAQLEFDAALATFDRLGARPDADRLRGATGGTDHGGPDGLSSREVEVLRLLAEGRSNRDIGEALVISEHTVRRHLSNVYRKIGVSTRSAATAYAFEHDLA